MDDGTARTKGAGLGLNFMQTYQQDRTKAFGFLQMTKSYAEMMQMGMFVPYAQSDTHYTYAEAQAAHDIHSSQARVMTYAEMLRAQAVTSYAKAVQNAAAR